MKVIRDGDSRLEVRNSYFFLPAGAVVLGAGYLSQELPKLYRGQEHFSDRNFDVGLAVAALFIVVGLCQVNYFRVCFDRLQERMTWTKITVFGRQTRSLSLRKIHDAGLEVGQTGINDHPKWGPPKRVVIRTEEGLIPLAGGYNYASASADRAVAAVNDFLRRR